MLKEEAEEFAATFGLERFQCSNGWMKQFILYNFINSNFNLYSIVTTIIALHSI